MEIGPSRMAGVLSVKQSEAHLKLLRQAAILRGEKERRHRRKQSQRYILNVKYGTG